MATTVPQELQFPGAVEGPVTKRVQESAPQTDRHTDRQTDTQTHRQTHRQTDGWGTWCLAVRGWFLGLGSDVGLGLVSMDHRFFVGLFSFGV